MQNEGVDAESRVIDEEGGSLKTSCSLTVRREVILRRSIDFMQLLYRSDAELESGSIFSSLDDMQIARMQFAVR